MLAPSATGLVAAAKLLAQEPGTLVHATALVCAGPWAQLQQVAGTCARSKAAAEAQHVVLAPAQALGAWPANLVLLARMCSKAATPWPGTLVQMLLQQPCSTKGACRCLQAHCASH